MDAVNFLHRQWSNEFRREYCSSASVFFSRPLTRSLRLEICLSLDWTIHLNSATSCLSSFPCNSLSLLATLGSHSASNSPAEKSSSFPADDDPRKRLMVDNGDGRSQSVVALDNKSIYCCCWVGRCVALVAGLDPVPRLQASTTRIFTASTSHCCVTGSCIDTRPSNQYT